jgi:hypothetical protein
MLRNFRTLVAAVAAFSLAGCAGSYYNIPKETYLQKVRTLGVLPIYVDPGSDIRHPQKDEVVALIREFNRKNEKELAVALKETGGYFMISQLEGDPDRQFENLYFRREIRDDAGVVYNKYFLKQQEVRDLFSHANIDAVMIMVVSGITKRDKVSSGNLLKYLEAEYNSLILTAQILDREGTILWEYPNFRQHSPSLPVFFPLQFPDFDEAEANLDEKVEIKFRKVAGLRRALEKQGKDYLFRTTGVSQPYQRIFDDMVSLLRPELRLFGSKENEARPVDASAGQTAPAAENSPGKLSEKPAVKPVDKPQPKPAAEASPAPAAPAPPAAAEMEKPIGEPEPIVETPVK